jgi:hypothetical protein
MNSTGKSSGDRYLFILSYSARFSHHPDSAGNRFFEATEVTFRNLAAIS